MVTLPLPVTDATLILYSPGGMSFTTHSSETEPNVFVATRTQVSVGDEEEDEDEEDDGEDEEDDGVGETDDEEEETGVVPPCSRALVGTAFSHSSNSTALKPAMITARFIWALRPYWLTSACPSPTFTLAPGSVSSKGMAGS